MEQLVIILSLWLTANFDLPPAAELPHVVQMPSEQIAAIHYGNANDGRTNAADFLGAYDSRTETIYLREGWSPGSVADVSVLVHELVHHLQHRADLRYSCPQAREALAYEAQARWLALFGDDLESAFALDRMSIKLKTQCLPH